MEVTNVEETDTETSVELRDKEQDTLLENVRQEKASRQQKIKSKPNK